MRLDMLSGWSLSVLVVAALLAEGDALAQAPPGVPGAVPPARDGAGAGRSVLPAAESTPAEPEILLADAIRAALENNRNVGIARRRVGIAEDRMSEAKAGDWPRVTFEGATSQRDQPPASVLPPAFATAFRLPPGSGLSQGDLYTATTRTALVLPLTDFGRTSNLKQSAKFGVDVAQLNSERTEQDITLQVSQAYYRVLQAKKIRQVVLESIDSVQQQLRDAKAFLTQGLVASSDVLSAEVRLAERQQDLIQAETNLQVATATLNRVMGFDLNRKLRLKDVSSTPTWSGNYETLVQTAHQNRSDLKAARLQMLSSEADLRLARADNYPRLNAYAEYDTNSTSLLLHKEWAATGLTLSMTLFSGGAQSAVVERRQKELLEAQDQFLERQDNISFDVKQAYLIAGQTFDSVRVAEKNQQLAAENLRIFRDRYSQGLVTSTDVLTAEDSASRARLNYFQALYDYHSARARLENVIGQSKLP
jgi:outer membrane protein